MGAALQIPQEEIQAEINDNLAQQGVTTTTTRSVSQMGAGAMSGSFVGLLAAASNDVLTDVLMQAAQTTRIDDDFAGWLVDQASALRERRTFSLDWDNLAEELEDMYAQLEKDLESDLRVILEHLLKLECEPGENEWKGRSRKWKSHTIEHRSRIDTILEKSPKLREKIAAFIAKQYPNAIRKVAAQTSRRRSSFPSTLPWSADQILEPDFFPNPFNLPTDDD